MDELIYDSKVRLTFNEGNHRYMVSKNVKDDLWTVPEPVVGVTTVCGVINKPFLMLWPMNMALAYIKDWWVNREGEELFEQAIRNAAQAHKQKSDAGKKTGKVGHALVEALIQGKAVKMPSDPTLLKEAESVKSAFESWQEDFKPEPLQTEKIAYSLTHNFAGTIDLIALIDGKTCIVDYKTTATSRFNPMGIYGDNYCQLGAYAILAEEMLGLEIEDAMVVNLSKTDGEYQCKSLSDMGMDIVDAKMYFLNARGLYELNKTFDWKLKNG